MKKQLAHITSIGLLLIYTLSMLTGSYNDIKINHDFASQNQSLEFKANDNHFLAHTVPSEDLSSIDSSFPQPTDSEDKPLLISTLLKQHEQWRYVAFKQYVENSNNVLIAYRKKDIIYPFHYYW